MTTWNNGKCYVIIEKETKKPTHPFKSVKDRVPFNIAKEVDNCGFVLEKDMCVIDFDDEVSANIAFNIVKGLKLKTRVIKTKRGYHMYFKNTNQTCINKCFTKKGWHVDLLQIANGASTSYAIIKKDGKFREVVIDCELENLDEVPPIFYPFSAEGYDVIGLKEGDGRNDLLFRYMGALFVFGFSKTECKKIGHVINDFVFAEPLDDIEVVLRDDGFKGLEQGNFTQKKKAKKEAGHIALAEYALEKLTLKVFNDTIYTYNGEYYTEDTKEIERAFLQKKQDCTVAKRKEALSYLKLLPKLEVKEVNDDPFTFNLKNGRYNLKSQKLSEHSSNFFDIWQLPVIYDPKANEEILEKTLLKVFCGNVDLVELFYEACGYMLLGNNSFRKGFLFLGGGSNGKSTILNMLKTFIGEKNYTSLSLNDLADKFRPAELFGKIANINDDIDNTFIRQTGDLKKFFTGESVTVEKKGQDPFKFNSRAKMFFSMNELPKTSDKTEGFYSRLVILPFLAYFSPCDEDYDPFIEEKLTAQKTLSTLLNKAIFYGARLIKNKGKFSVPAISSEALEEYKTHNNIILEWIREEEKTAESFTNDTCLGAYTDFMQWCKLNNISKVPGRNAFYKEVCVKFSLEKAVVKRMNKSVRTFKKIDNN